MASRYQIQLQYRTALQQAAKLEELAEDLMRTAKNGIGETMSDLQTCWTGENARAYLVKGTHLKKKVTDTSNDLKKAAAAIRRIATNTYNAEMRALELAKRRTYGSGGSGGGGGR